MNDIRYLLDENVDSVFRTALLNQEPAMVVWKISDPGVPLKGTKDPEILEWCEENTFVLVTNNRASMPVHLADHLAKGRHIPGILELNANMSLNETVEELTLIWGASELEEYQDIIIYLPVN
ncbi:MAG: hypothetical protein DRI57_17375 [Deltaproteobacteria bacterium]|nr:MAG: hypothetical protein DRI57_17375 [Deltaproteobacteria bacterium]